MSATLPHHGTGILEEIRQAEEVQRPPSRLYAFLRILSSAGAVLLSQPKPRHVHESGGVPEDIADQLTQLKSLLDQGVLTPEEFAAAKAKLLSISSLTH